MNVNAPMLLIGIGGAGVATARKICDSFGEGIRAVFADTDAASGGCGVPGSAADAKTDERFVLLGGDRLSGRGSGGVIVKARLAAEESMNLLDKPLEGVRLAVIVTSLGGGTGGGATLEAVRYLKKRGVSAVVFATTPFTFEGDDRQRNARGILSMIEDAANASFFIALDKLVGEVDNMEAAMRRATDTLAAAATLFWRLVLTPGYIRLDAERIRHAVVHARRARFATATTQGEGRAERAVAELAAHPLLTNGSGPVRSILCGVLAGDDLRLSEVAAVADGLKATFGENCVLEISTVNDEANFSGRLSVVAMLFESAGKGKDAEDEAAPRKDAAQSRKGASALSFGPQGRGRFNNTAPTFWNNEDLDIPTYIRQRITLDA